MLKLKGGQKLSGSVTISGSKNAALPVIAAALLTKKVTLHNIPRIGDVFTFLKIIESLNVKVDFTGNTLKLDTTDISMEHLDLDLIKKIRVGVFLLPILLKNFGSVSIPYPGGCNIGKRPIDEILKGLSGLGYTDKTGTSEVVDFSGKMKEGDINVTIDWFSVTGTENLLIASALRKGKTNIYLAAIEPHVMDVVNFLNHAGANITLGYDHTITVNGVESLQEEVEYTIIHDYIEAGTFIVLGALASREYIDIHHACITDLRCVLAKCEEAGVRFEDLGNDTLRVYNSIDNLRAVRFQTKVFPGFPTDLQSPFCVLLTQADGISRVEEVIYEGRLNFLVEIEKMRGHPAILNPHEALIFGKTPLRGATVSSWDLRAGVAMIIAGLIATGETHITNVVYIERGYEDIIGKIRKLGAEMEKVGEE